MRTIFFKCESIAEAKSLAAVLDLRNFKHLHRVVNEESEVIVPCEFEDYQLPEIYEIGKLVHRNLSLPDKEPK